MRLGYPALFVCFNCITVPFVPLDIRLLVNVFLCNDTCPFLIFEANGYLFTARPCMLVGAFFVVH